MPSTGVFLFSAHCNLARLDWSLQESYHFALYFLGVASIPSWSLSLDKSYIVFGKQPAVLKPFSRPAIVL